jgi:hypothetical protein
VVWKVEALLFPEKKSGLVRLSDAVKIGLQLCGETSAKVLAIYSQGEPHFSRAREIARRVEQGKVNTDQADEQIRQILASIPLEVANTGAALQGQLYSQALSTVLMCCFSLESYVNSFAYFLIKESDFLGLSKSGRKSSAEAVLYAIDRLSTREKWETIGKMGSAIGFDRSRTPFQDFRSLFNFRDDNVHDKAIPYSEDRAAKRYNKKFPDPVFGSLDLGHALFAADVYWNMVQEIHQLTGVDAEVFHRHYNLRPWFDDENRRSLQELAVRYRDTFPTNG